MCANYFILRDYVRIILLLRVRSVFCDVLPITHTHTHITICSLFEEEISHFTFPVSSTSSSSISSTAAASVPGPAHTEEGGGGGGVARQSPDSSSRQHLLSSLSSTSSEVQSTLLNLDLNEQVEQAGQQSTVDRDDHTCMSVLFVKTVLCIHVASYPGSWGWRRK